MSAADRVTVDLRDEDASFVDELVTSGDYASPEDAVSAGLEALRERKAAFNRWLEAEVIPAYDRVKADPSSVLTPEQVRLNLLAHHEARSKPRG